MHASYLVYDKGRGSCKYFVGKGKTNVLFRATVNKEGATEQLFYLNPFIGNATGQVFCPNPIIDHY
jgi:hypothetical protein